jgi:hypothetical protein
MAGVSSKRFDEGEFTAGLAGYFPKDFGKGRRFWENLPKRRDIGKFS